MRFARFLLLLVLPLLPVDAPAQQQSLPRIEVKVAGKPLSVEVAATSQDRSTGLMHRRMLPEDWGMLFVFPDVAYHGMWMRNTLIPLSVAFLDDKGVIINIRDMKPQTEETHAASNPARYALEVNAGWFRKHGIGPGAKITGLEAAPAPR